MGACTCNAQMTSGYTFGVNLTTMKIRMSGVHNIQMPAGVRFGLGYDILISEKFHFQSAFILTSKGTDYKVGNTDISLAPTYLEMPLNITAKLGIRQNRKTLIFAGPYLATAIGGYKIYGNNPINRLSLGRGGDIRVFDTGINIGAGMSFKHLNFTVQYGIGLSNLSPSSNGVMRNRVIGICMSTLYPPSKR